MISMKFMSCLGVIALSCCWFYGFAKTPGKTGHCLVYNTSADYKENAARKQDIHILQGRSHARYWSKDYVFVLGLLQKTNQPYRL